MSEDFIGVREANLKGYKQALIDVRMLISKLNPNEEVSPNQEIILLDQILLSMILKM